MANGNDLKYKQTLAVESAGNAMTKNLAFLAGHVFRLRWHKGAREYLRKFMGKKLVFVLLTMRALGLDDPIVIRRVAVYCAETFWRRFTQFLKEAEEKKEPVEPQIMELAEQVRDDIQPFIEETVAEVYAQPVEAEVAREGASAPTPTDASLPVVTGEVIPPAKVEDTPVSTPAPVIEVPPVEETPQAAPTPVVKEEPKPLFDGLTVGESAMLAVMHRKVQSGVKLSDHDQKVYEILYNAVLTHGDPDANPKSVRDQIIEAFMPTQLAQAGEAIRNKIVEAKKEEAAAMANLSNVLNGTVAASAAAIPVSTVPEEMVVIGNGVPTSTPAPAVTTPTTPVAALVTPTPTPTPINNKPAQPANSNQAAPAATPDKRSWLARATDMLKTANTKMDAKRSTK
jgi:hypothetical protein